MRTSNPPISLFLVFRTSEKDLQARFKVGSRIFSLVMLLLRKSSCIRVMIDFNYSVGYLITKLTKIRNEKIYTILAELVLIETLSWPLQANAQELQKILLIN